MSILRTMRKADACPPSGPHPYIDTPDFAYDQWLAYLDQKKTPIGLVKGNPRVAIVGGGVSGLCAAYELLRAGCVVSVFEQANEVGGRCASILFPGGGSDLAELGSMRFPPTEFVLDFYLKKFGIIPDGLCSLPDFPDPGVRTTYICYGGEVETWQSGSPNPPDDFATVNAGWRALIKDGLSTNAGLVLRSAVTITSKLASGEIDTAARYWQAWLDAFGQKTFYSALFEIFTGHGGYLIPGGRAWTLTISIGSARSGSARAVLDRSIRSAS
jgi:tryptophan 2-monooxygenase